MDCETYTTKEVMGLTGLSLRQIQWWDEKGYVPCRQIIGHKRRWQAEQVRIMTVAKAIRDKGVRPEQAARIAGAVVRSPEAEARWVIVGSLSGGWCVAGEEAGVVRMLSQVIDEPAIVVRVPRWDSGLRPASN